MFEPPFFRKPMLEILDFFKKCNCPPSIHSFNTLLQYTPLHLTKGIANRWGSDTPLHLTSDLVKRWGIITPLPLTTGLVNMWGSNTPLHLTT